MAEQLSLFGRLLRRLAPGEDRLLRLVRAGGGSFQRVVLTRNRRVMVSAGDGGGTLRLHEAFASAPDEVLAAIGRLYSAPTARDRNAARAVVQAFLKMVPPPTAAPRPRRRPVSSADRPHLQRLQAEFDRVNHEFFDDALPTVPLSLSGRMKRRNGHFCTHPLEIVLSRRLCVHAAPGEAEQTLRHEMIHLWQHAQGRRPDHGMEFRRWARRLGVHPRATRTVRWKATE